ncbi:MAG: hypothetical protein EOM12_03385 [Verrucomicrobiae bacterium]|nr:hypothetical protein [Verrucomicrobiae bacterium]
MDDFLQYFNNKVLGLEKPHPFWHFEPWDVKKRSDEVIDLANKDMVDLYSKEMMLHNLQDPHPFQTGYLKSTKPIRGLLGPTQGGKSKCPLMEITMMATGHVPIAFRYEEGEDTGIERIITEENIIRWGRRDTSTGEIIDYDSSQLKSRPTGWKEWNCGNIIGVGRYPEGKIAQPGDLIWIGTTLKALKQQWWPKITPTPACEIPEEFFDTRKCNNGVNSEDTTIYYTSGVAVVIITYESKWDRFEARGVHAIFLDEEPEDARVIPAAITHCKYLSITATPYRGITYMKDLLFPEEHNPALYLSHACAYDSPYLTAEKIAVNRTICPDYEIGARIWGMPTAIRGRPYFSDIRKIQYWRRKYKIPYTLSRIMPDKIVENSGQDFTAKLIPSEDEKDGMTWRIYEEVIPDTAYWLTADSAEGAEVEEEAGDSLSSIIFRSPKKGETKPVIVAELDTWVDIQVFANMCLAACRYYNSALMCAEGPTRGSYNALFYAETRDYPYWYRQTTIKDATRKMRKTIGFDTNTATRKAIIDNLAIWITEYGMDEFPEINSERVLKQMAECVVKFKNGKPRPDHETNGAMDLLICMGQGYHVFNYYREQIRCNRKKVDNRRKISLANQIISGKEKPVYMGDIRLNK